jgi:16S rRNA processing protein RimM
VPESNSSTDPSVDPDGHVLVGRVGKAHGLNGHVFVIAESDNPQRFSPGSTMSMDGRPVTVTMSRLADGRLVVGFAGVNDRNSAERLRDARLTIPETQRRGLDQDEWWPEDLVGLRVLDHGGTDRGEVVEVVEGVAQDRLAVRTLDGGVFEIPFVADLVPVVDVAAGHIRLADVEGLLTE